MSKKCRQCGADVLEQANFCQNCGGSEFDYADMEQTTVLNEPNNSYSEVPLAENQNQNNQQASFNQPTWQPPQIQEKPKKKTGLIVGIIVAVVVLLSGIGIATEKALQSQGYGQDDMDIGSSYDSNSDDNSNSDIEYTKGSFDGTTYINEWADIQLVMPSGYKEADSSIYANAENETTDCGLYLMADDTMSMIFISYEKLPYSFFGEEEYLDSVMNTLESSVDVVYETTDEYTTETVGEYSYAKAVCPFDNNYGSFVNSFYVRKIDDYMVVISAIGTSEDVIETLVNNITQVD